MINKIDITRKYRTRDGREVRIYATGVGRRYLVQGAVRRNGRWVLRSWDNLGHIRIGDQSEYDLIEVRPRIKRTVWLGLYSDNVVAYSDQKDAIDSDAVEWPDVRLACVKVEIDCEEGFGLD